MRHLPGTLLGMCCHYGKVVVVPPDRAGVCGGGGGGGHCGCLGGCLGGLPGWLPWVVAWECLQVYEGQVYDGQ